MIWFKKEFPTIYICYPYKKYIQEVYRFKKNVKIAQALQNYFSLTLHDVVYFLLRAFAFSLISNMTKILTMTVTVAIAAFC